LPKPQRLALLLPEISFGKKLSFFMTTEQLHEIADNLEFGLRCFVHKDNADIRFIPDERELYGFDEEPWEEDIKAIEKGREQYLEIEKMSPQEEFVVMEAFIHEVDQQWLREKLQRILSRPKPFRNFKAELQEEGHYWHKWFAFKRVKMLAWVSRQLQHNSDLLHQ
jgi:hypothetical protein